jgi:hypothetical protein
VTSQNADTEAPIDSLRKTLASCPAGPIDEEAHSLIERLLAKTWEDLHGSGEQQMTASKLLGRTEKLNWEPTLLSFVIEHTVHWLAVAPRAGNCILGT